MVDRATDVALFRYSLIREAADEALSPAGRGRLVRALAAEVHEGPLGRVRVSRETLDRWIRAWRRGGFEALKPGARHVNPRTPAEVLELAERLRRENPERTGAHICEILRAVNGWSPDQRTIQRHLARRGLNRKALSATAVTYGRFEASEPNELWVGDALHGPVVGARKAILFAFLDDHSRAFTGHRWTWLEDTLRLEAALRAGIEARGLPGAIYVDNGSPFASRQLDRACAQLGIRLIHSRPGRPEGRGKIERVFRTVRDQFLVEIRDGDIAELADINRLFGAWVETVYHPRPHSETDQAPIERFLAAGAPTPPGPGRLREAFLWSETRVVTKTATVSLHSNTYEVDAALVGRRVELVFDPFDLTDITVRYQDRAMGQAVPHRVGRHSHPQARPEIPEPPVAPTGIDYLALVDQRHQAETAKPISYGTAFGDGDVIEAGPDDGQLAGQLRIPVPTGAPIQETRS
ncbi:MAG: DDE-type integrase/transposase/recombinase [Acidimicrobiales bacterium]